MDDMVCWGEGVSVWETGGFGKRGAIMHTCFDVSERSLRELYLPIILAVIFGDR